MTKKERQQFRAQTHRMQARLVMGVVCSECGGDHKLEYHHKDPSTKKFNVAQYFGRASWQRIEAELTKCVMLCRPCHERTF